MRHWVAGLFVMGLFACESPLVGLTLLEQSSTVVPGIAGDGGEITEALSKLELEISTTQQMQSSRVSLSTVREVVLLDLILMVADPEEGSLDFIHAIDVYVGAPGLPDVLVATLEEVPKGLRDVTLELIDVDLTEYVATEEMTYTTIAVGAPPTATTTIDVELALGVYVTAAGLCSSL